MRAKKKDLILILLLTNIFSKISRCQKQLAMVLFIANKEAFNYITLHLLIS